MKQDLSDCEDERSDSPLIHPAAAFVSVGMILPEYMMVVVVGTCLAMMTKGLIDRFHAGHLP
jgi:hypothetical protein